MQYIIPNVSYDEICNMNLPKYVALKCIFEQEMDGEDNIMMLGNIVKSSHNSYTVYSEENSSIIYPNGYRLDGTYPNTWSYDSVAVPYGRVISGPDRPLGLKIHMIAYTDNMYNAIDYGLGFVLPTCRDIVSLTYFITNNYVSGIENQSVDFTRDVDELIISYYNHVHELQHEFNESSEDVDYRDYIPLLANSWEEGIRKYINSTEPINASLPTYIHTNGLTSDHLLTAMAEQIQSLRGTYNPINTESINPIEYSERYQNYDSIIATATSYIQTGNFKLHMNKKGIRHLYINQDSFPGVCISLDEKLKGFGFPGRKIGLSTPSNSRGIYSTTYIYVPYILEAQDSDIPEIHTNIKKHNNKQVSTNDEEIYDNSNMVTLLAIADLICIYGRVKVNEFLSGYAQQPQS